MKKLSILAALAVALAAPAAFADNSADINVSATVPTYCEIINDTPDAHVDFAPGSTGAGLGKSLMVRCNKDMGFSIYNSTADEDGEFEIQGVSGTTNTMKVLLSTSAYTPWPSGTSIFEGGTGTGEYQHVSYNLDFNPGGAIIPASGEYQGILTFNLVAAY